MVAPSPGQGAPLHPLALALSAQEGGSWKCCVWPQPRNGGGERLAQTAWDSGLPSTGL